jgi:hypothetical protein
LLRPRAINGKACSHCATFLRGFILAVFISPSAFFCVTRALRIGLLFRRYSLSRVEMNGFAALDVSVPPKGLSLRRGITRKKLKPKEKVNEH